MKKIKIFLLIILIGILLILGINAIIIFNTKNKIYSKDDINETYDYALVLGCGVKKNGEPSKMLKDRLNMAINLFESKKINNIIISGDHKDTYSEVEVMEQYLINNGIAKINIIRDDLGFSTSESIKNYSEHYKENSVIIISQKYHLYRALFMAQRLNIKAVGVHAELINYGGQFLREIREILARTKDYIKSYFF